MQDRYRSKTVHQALGHVVEECDEVLQAIGKTQRWGLDSFNPDMAPERREVNRSWVLRELADLEVLILVVLGIPYLIWVQAFVITNIWNLFRPEWVPALELRTAIGLAFVVTMLRPAKLSKSAEYTWASVIGAFIAPWLMLGFAHVIFFLFFR